MTDYLNEAAIRSLEASGDYRVLRRVPEPHMLEDEAMVAGAQRIAIVDVETTGLDPESDSIIEIAVMHMLVDRDRGCELVGHGKPQSWLEDPKRPLDPRIEALTGLDNAMLEGHAIDDKAVIDMLEGADVIVAHNAAFDAAFVERRWPVLRGLRWACSCHEIDWPTLGYEGRSLPHLLMQSGFFNNAHRAADDVWSLHHLLTWVMPGSGGEEGRCHLDRLLEASETETFRIEATHAPFRAKDQLKARGYRWDAARRVWWTEIGPDGFLDEKVWFDERGLPPFTFSRLSAAQRHR